MTSQITQSSIFQTTTEDEKERYRDLERGREIKRERERKREIGNSLETCGEKDKERKRERVYVREKVKSKEHKHTTVLLQMSVSVECVVIDALQEDFEDYLKLNPR